MHRAAFIGAAVGGLSGALPFVAWAVLPDDHPVSAALTKAVGPHITKLQQNIWKQGHDRPQRIIIVRHGQTHGYAHTCDCQVGGVRICAQQPEVRRPLTEEGKIQAMQAGVALKKIIGEEDKTIFYSSPFLGCRQTFNFITDSFSKSQVQYVEDPRIRNIDHGDLYLETSAEKVDTFKEGSDKVGKFYFRWPQGECCADVHDRVCSFLETIYRKWQLPNRPENIVIITHSVVAQVFLMRWFHWDVDTFDRLNKFKNGQVVVMEKQKDGAYKLITPLPARPPLPSGVKLLSSATAE